MMYASPGFPDDQQVKKAFDAILQGKSRDLLTIIYPNPEAFFRKTNPDGSGGTLLHAATQADNLACMDLLFNKRFAVDATDNEGRNLLHIATSTTSAGMVLQHAKSNGLDMIAEQDFDGNLPYHRLAQNGHTKVLSYLLQVASNTPSLIMRTNMNGDSVLHELARHAPELIPSIISVSMDVRVKNKNGQTAHDLCNNQKSRIFLGAHMTLRDDSESRARASLLRQVQASNIIKSAEKAKALVGQDLPIGCDIHP